MKIRIVLFLFVALLFSDRTADAQRKAPAPKARVLTSRQIAEKVMPSVVLIITQDENGKPISQGSGFVYKPGLVVTNLHVFERASNAIVKNVKTGEVFKAIEVVAMNVVDDLCVFRIDKEKILPLKLGDSKAVRTGDEIYVASNPKGLEGSFTKGIVSSVRKGQRDNRYESGDGDDFIEELTSILAGPRELALIQIDAAISSGSSGGVLVNARAEAIGIIKSSIVSGQNINFAIPISQLLLLPQCFRHPIQLAGALAYSDLKKDRLMGPVKTVTEKGDKRKVIDGKMIEGDSPMRSKIEYDRFGNHVSYWTYDLGGSENIIKYFIEYDQNGIKTSVQEEFPGGARDKVRFDLEGGIFNKLLTKNFSGSVGSPDSQVGKQLFDSRGNRYEWIFPNARRRTYVYDNTGREKEMTEFKDGVIHFRDRFRYKDDEYGNWIEKSTYSNYPNTKGLDPTEWIEGDTIYREILYFQD